MSSLSPGPPPLPRIEPRRASDFRRELMARARAWIPAWGTQDAPGDFGAALLDIGARLSGEVAERLDRTGDKMARGLLDWLAVRGLAARPARMPVALKLTDTAQAPVLAPAPVRLQVDVDGASVVFETEQDVQLVPGKLDRLVAVDAAGDAYYLPPPGLTSLDPVVPQPMRWRTKSFAAAGTKTLQLDPPLGLAVGMQVDIAGVQYGVTAVSGDLVTIDPPLQMPDGLDQDATVDVVAAFAPFEPGRRNQQRHSLYLGHDDLLNLEARSTLEVRNAQSLLDLDWQYWGKVGDGEVADWQTLEVLGVENEGLRLRKPKGAVDPTLVGPVQSRWIRATTPHLDTAQPLLSVDGLAIAINPKAGELKCPADDVADAGDVPELEAFANTTPLVLNTLFHPLGREPRQFDAFYLGSAEIFSKPRASVSLCFEMSDPTVAAFSVVRTGWLQYRVLAGVGRDRALHLFIDDPTTGNVSTFPNRPLLQPPLPSVVPATGTTTSTTTIALDKPKAWRLPAWSDDVFEFSIAVAAGNGVWIWRERVLNPTQSGWRPLGSSLPAPTTQGATIDGLVYVDDSAVQTMFALREKQLFGCAIAGSAWTEVDTRAGAARVDFVSIAPIVDHTTKRVTGLVGVANDNTVYEIKTTGACTQLATTTVDPQFIPAARRVTDTVGTRLYVIAANDATSFVSISPVSGIVEAIDADATILGDSLELAVTDLFDVFAIASARIDGATYLAAWGSLDAPLSTELFLSTVSPSIGSIGGAPTVLDRFIVAPGSQGDALVADWTPSALISGTGTLGQGIAVPTSFPLAPNDIVAADAATTMVVTGYPTILGNEAFHAVPAAFATGASGKPILAFRVSNPASAVAGTFLLANGELQLAVNDHHLSAPGIILMTSGAGTAPVVYAVTSVDAATGNATLANPPAIADMTPVTYWRAENSGARVVPTLTLSAPDNAWDAVILAREPLTFRSPAAPARQSGKAFRIVAGNHPELIVLDSAWSTLPPDGHFVVNAALGAWRRSLGDASANPELAWEYWNGSTWWTLGVTQDTTLNLKSTGLVRFTVPGNLAPTEVAGRQNHWLRARLVGGDYGREQVKVKVKDLGNGVTEQTVERTSGDVRAPAVLALRVQYASDATRPTFVLTEDSGSIRDQSQANATDGALLEAFVPLSVTLGRLQRGATPATSADDCDCDPRRVAATAADAADAGARGPGAGRALFLGFDARLFGTPVNVLLVVDREQPHEGFAPLAVDVLSGDRFEPLIVQDTTRALGESGLLSLSFPIAPKPATLFGQTRTWLRLRPSRDDPTMQWRPHVRGAYLNTVWASAAESLTREPLGSSDGRPMLTLRVARPPLVHDSLELRVREPLGEEERAALRREDPTRVLSEVRDLPGDWVRWEAVADTADHGPDDRVFALDETLGELQFGDGRHGMIPPIGRDGVVAFRYARTEPPQPGQRDAPANRVQARMALNLVTPVESVEAAIAAGQAAGGAPPEVDTRVLRFGYARLRHRGRAVTREDFEDLALQSNVDVAQARCFVRDGRVRLVVVMRDGFGPSRAQARELRRALLETAPPSLAAVGALSIDGPRPRALRVALRLSVADLDDAGRVAGAARAALAALFDPALGGVDGRGWPLGALPRDDDVAYALADVADLESIDEIGLAFVDALGQPQAWPGRLPADALAVLGQDATRIDFTPIEAREEAGA